MALINNNKHFPVWLFKLRSMNTVTVFPLIFMNSYYGNMDSWWLLLFSYVHLWSKELNFLYLMAHYRDQLTTENTQNGAANAASGEKDYFSSLQEKYSSFPVVIFTLEFFRQGRNKCPCQQKHRPSGLVSQWPHSTGQSWRAVIVWNVHSRTILELHALDGQTMSLPSLLCCGLG